MVRFIQYQWESLIGNGWTFQCWNWRLSPIAEFHRTIWVWVLLCIGAVCFLLIVLNFFRVTSAFVPLLGWAVFFWFWCALLISLFYRDVRPGISLLFNRETLPICTVGQVWMQRMNGIWVNFFFIYFSFPFLCPFVNLIYVALKFHWEYRWVFTCFQILL
jgi:hypothetical protein